MAGGHRRGADPIAAGAGARDRGPGAGDDGGEGDDRRRARPAAPDFRRHAATILGFALIAGAGCHDPIADLDEVYYRGSGRGPGGHVVCAVNIDDSAGNDVDSLLGGLDRAARTGEVLQLYGHVPGRTVAQSTIDAILAGAHSRGLASFTYADLAAGRPAEAGLALSFDDSSIEEWSALADRLDAAGVRVTFFVTRYHLFTDGERAALHELAARGHDVEAHTVWHRRAPDVAEDVGVAGYLADEVLPGLELLRADGYRPTVFAYPFGARTSELDRGLLEQFALLRSVSYSTDGPLVVDPCPD